MACTLKKSAVDALVLSAVKAANPGKKNITMYTPFDLNGLGENGIRRRRYYIPIRTEMLALGCVLKSLTANNMSKHKDKTIVTVQDLADVVWADRK